jgi:hypothetical protein
MSANIFQTLFDVSVPDKVNGINDNDLMGGGKPEDAKQAVEPSAPLENPAAKASDLDANTKASAPNENANPNAKASAPNENTKPNISAPAANTKPNASAPPANTKPNASAPPANEFKKTQDSPAKPNGNSKEQPAIGVPVIEAKNANPDKPKSNAALVPTPAREPIKICETTQILKRAILIIFIFSLATYLAAITLTIRPILEFVLGSNVNLDINNDDDYIKKWAAIAKLLLIYIAFIFAYVIGIIIVIATIVMIFFVFSGSNTVIDDTKLFMLFNFWQFEDESYIWYIYAVLSAIILIAVIVFLYYHFYVRSYIENLSYPNIAELGKSEFPTPTKFILYFGLYLSMLYLLYLLFLNNDLPGGNFIYTSLFVATIMLFISVIYRYTLNRGHIEIPIAAWFIFGLCVFLYTYLLEMLPQIIMTGWTWLIAVALMITIFILVSSLSVIVILGTQENTPINKDRIEMLIGPIATLITIIIIGIVIFICVAIKDKIET